MLLSVVRKRSYLFSTGYTDPGHNGTELALLPGSNGNVGGAVPQGLVAWYPYVRAGVRNLGRREMKRIILAIAIGVFAVGTVVQADTLTGTITVPSVADEYDYVISAERYDFSSGGNIYGDLTILSGFASNDVWYTLGLIDAEQVDRALITYGVPSYMFNNSVFVMGFNPSGGHTLQTGDYAGDFPNGIGPSHSIGTSATFNLRLVGDVDGGIAYLATDGGSEDAGLAYGSHNWDQYGWDLGETYDNVYLIAQIYTSGGSAGSVEFSFDTDVAPIPEPASMALLGMGLVGLVATRIRKRRVV